MCNLAAMRLFHSGVFVFFLLACSSKTDQSSEFSFDKLEKSTPATEKEAASVRIDLINKGVGPIQSVKLSKEVDQSMVETGSVLYQQKCTVCHRIGGEFIGPPPNGILKRRAPEWIMNMMLNPEVMLKEDQLARDLFMEYNGAPMANQGLTESEARAILEYFRTLD